MEVENFNISRDSVIEWKKYVENLEALGKEFGIVDNAYKLSKKIARESDIGPARKTSGNTIFSKEEMNNLVLEFYSQMEPDIFDIVRSIMDEENLDFELAIYDSEIEKDAPKTPMVTTKEEAKLKGNCKCDDVICVPIPGYNKDNPNIRLEHVIQLVHELAHAVAGSMERNRDNNGKLDYDFYGSQMHFLFGEVESQCVELAFCHFLKGKSEKYDIDVQNYIKNTFVRGIKSNANESYLKLGIGKFAFENNLLNDESNPELSSTEINKLAEYLNISSGKILQSHLKQFLHNGDISSNDTFKYMLGGLFAIKLNQKSKNLKDFSSNLKTFFEHVKENNFDDSIKFFGLDGFCDESMNKLLDDYKNFAKEIESKNDIIHIENIKGAVQARKDEKLNDDELSK